MTAEVFSDMPMIAIPVAMTDDDVNAHTDVLYWRSLLKDVIDRIVMHDYRPLPWPTDLSDDMAAMTAELTALRRHHDHPAELIGRWKHSPA